MKSLSTKIILLVVAALVISNSILCSVVIVNSRDSIKDSIQQRMLDIANCAAGSVDGDMLGRIRSEDKDSPEYRSIYNSLAVFRDNVELKYVYGVRREEDGRFTFTVDPTIDDPAQFGQEVVRTEALVKAGEGAPAVDEVPYEDEWGRFYSAYSPVFDSSGKVAGIIGVDFSVKWFESQLSDRHRSTVMTYMTLLFFILLLAVLISLLVVGSITDPLKKMTKVAKEYGEGNFDEEIVIESRDEVGELSRTLQSMSTSLKEQIEKSRSADKAKGEFLANMSHEIRTPINAILGMNEMIVKETVNPEIRGYSENIRSSGERLMEIVGEILDFQEIDKSITEIIPTAYYTVFLINSLVGTAKYRAEEKGLKFNAYIDENLPRVLYGDDVRITQVISNLLSNAVKYTKEGEITFKMKEAGRDNNLIVLDIAVEDTGIGIRSEDLEKLGIAFVRLEEEKNRNIEGAGLGMAIVNRLLNMMDSRLKVKSRYGKGSVFSFRLKQEIVDAMPLDPRTIRFQTFEEGSTKTWEAPPSIRFRDARVLLVDDYDMNLLVAKSLLGTFGITADLASSGDEALDMVEKNDYHLILLDHMMPDPDGVEVLRIMKERNMLHEGTKVVALTANALSGAREMYLSAGFDDYLSKPIETVNLSHMLVKYIPEELRIIEHAEGKKDGAVMDTLTSGTGSSDNTAHSSLNFEEELRKCGIDPETGLKNCAGKKELYLEVLKGFTEEAGKKEKDLFAALSGEDYKSYRIRVHSVKSLFRTIGAGDLSQKAKELEDAARNDDSDLIKEKHGGFIEEYRSLALKVGDILENKGSSPEAGHVVIVDDDEQVLKMSAAILESYGMRVTMLSGGNELLSYVRSGGDVDLVLLDILMPEMDGFETLAALRELEKDMDREIPVIFLTGDEDKASEARGFSMGALDFIRKPFDTEVLLHRIDNVISKTRQIRKLSEESQTDPLTGLINKTCVNDKLSELLKTEKGILLILDLDNFKSVNDIYGHDTGDKILTCFSGMLKKEFRSGDIIGRIGGDEFLVFLRGAEEESVISNSVRRLNEGIMDEAVLLMGQEMSIPLGVSGGAAMADGDGDFEDIFKKADRELLVVKKSGKHGARVWRKESRTPGVFEESSLSTLDSILDERSSTIHALWLGREEFINLYRYIKRHNKRYNEKAYRVLFHLTGEEMDKEEFTFLTDRFGEAVKNNLRSSDIMMQSDFSHFLVILPMVDDTDIEGIIDRIVSSWRDEEDSSSLKVSWEMEAI